MLCAGVGLLFFGQNYLIYPSAFPPGSRTGAYTCSFQATPTAVLSTLSVEVPTPADFDLPYQDLPLTTPDNVTLRCYLLTQRTEMPFPGAMPVETSEHETNEEVRTLYPRAHCGPPRSRSPSIMTLLNDTGIRLFMRDLG